MANENHRQAAEQIIDGRRISEIELGRAQVHAALAMTDVLRDILAELTAIRQAAQLPRP
jgi:hypothetical protein